MHNRSALDLTTEDEGHQSSNYISVTNFFTEVVNHADIYEQDKFKGIIVCGNFSKNAFGNYNIAVEPICWVMFERPDKSIYPIDIEIKGQPLIQVRSENLVGKLNNKKMAELQIYDEDVRYNTNTKYKRYSWTTDLTGFVKTYIETRKTNSQKSEVTRLFGDHNVKFE